MLGALCRPSSSILATASGNKLLFWTIAYGSPLFPASTIEYDESISGLAWEPSGSRLAIGLNQVGMIVVVNTANTSQAVSVEEAHDGAVESLSWSPDGRKIASGGDDGVIRIWDADTLQHLEHHNAHDWLAEDDQRITALSFSPDGMWLTTVGGDSKGLRMLLVGELDEGVQLFVPVSGASEALAWSPSGGRVVVRGTHHRDGSEHGYVVSLSMLSSVQTLSLSGVAISNSRAVAVADAEAHGGAISAESSGAVAMWAISMENSSFDANWASTSGGALKLSAELDLNLAESFQHLARANVSGCVFSNNSVPLLTSDNVGGAIAASRAKFDVSGSTFRGNSALDGAALYSGQSETLPLSSLASSWFQENHPDPTVFAGSEVSWNCFSGQWMPRSGAIKGDFYGCMSCLQGYYGVPTASYDDATCEGVCWKGHYCPAGTGSPLECGAGTHLPSSGAASNQSCIPVRRATARAAPVPQPL